jgi:hypothetical protein
VFAKWMQNVLNAGVQVSIQLVSPTSGEQQYLSLSMCIHASFHSISFPNEWGADAKGLASRSTQNNYVSIQLVSPTSGEEALVNFLLPSSLLDSGFHSISFPNEWGVPILG